MGNPSTSDKGADSLEALRGAGFDMSPSRQGELNAVIAAAAAEQRAVRRASITVSEAAERLGVTPGRLRQLIARRAIYAFREGRRWLVPEWQFDEDGLIPGLGLLVASLDRSLDPVAVTRFVTLPE